MKYIILFLISFSIFAQPLVTPTPCPIKKWYTNNGWTEGDICEGDPAFSKIDCEVTTFDNDNMPVPRSWIDCVDGKSKINETKKAAALAAATDAENIEENHKTELSGAKLFIKNFDCNSLTDIFKKIVCKYIKHKERL